MRKSDFTGWREVFSFTFAQTVKQKSYGIFLVIFSVIALVYSTGSSLISQYGEVKEKKADISEVVIFDETGLDIKYNDVFTSKKYKNVKIVSNPSKTIEEYEKQMEETPDAAMLIKISFDKEDELYHMLFVQGKKLGMSEITKVEFADEFCDYFEVAKMEAVNVSDKQRDFIQTDIVREVKKLSDSGEIIEKEKDSISFEDYFIMLMMLMVCLMLINIGGNQIALSIVTEKSSRVIEYLVLNVRPLALILGKLLATIVTSTLQMVAVGFCYVASPVIANILVPRLSKLLFGVVEVAETNTTIADETLAASIKMIHGIKIEFVILALVFVILGIVFFGLIAGLLGASVSKMDEMQESMVIFQLMLVLGCYADMGLLVMQMSGAASPALTKALSICPITSPFWVPGSMILGNMGWPVIIASFVAMLIVIVLMAILTASVYEAMIFYNGKTLKLKDIIALAFSKKKLVEKEEDNNEK